MLIGVALFFAMLLFSRSACSDDKDIRWVVSDWPPAFILNNGQTPQTPEQLGDGTGDRILKEIIARLPAYKHSFVQANPTRSWSEFAAGKHQCDTSAFKNPEREKIAYFYPITVLTPVSIVVRDDRRAALRLELQSMSLDRLVTDRTDLRGYVDAGRSYGAIIDSVLAKSGNSLIRSNQSNPGHLLLLLDADRMDYTLEYPIEVEYLRRQHQFKHDLHVIEIDEAPDLVTGYVACTRNEWGKAVIADIANAVHDAAQTDAFRNIILSWLPPSNVKAYRTKIDQFYDNLAKQKKSAQQPTQEN